MHLLMNDLVHKVRRLFREVDEDGNGKVFFFNGKVFVYLFFATAMLCLFFCNGKLLLLYLFATTRLTLRSSSDLSGREVKIWMRR